MTREEIARKRQKAVGREVEPHELPDHIRIVTELGKRIQYLENRDKARGMSGIMIRASSAEPPTDAESYQGGRE